MIRTLRYLFLVLLAILLVAVASANRAPVTVRLLPPDIARFVGSDWQLELPLFLVAFAGLLVGLLVGFVWEWLREGKHRAAASSHRRRATALEREVTRLKGTEARPGDDIIALLDSK